MLSPEYGVRNPYNGIVMEVPNHSKQNAEKMAALVEGSLIMVRMVSEWEVDA